MRHLQGTRAMLTGWSLVSENLMQAISLHPETREGYRRMGIDFKKRTKISTTDIVEESNQVWDSREKKAARLLAREQRLNSRQSSPVLTERRSWPASFPVLADAPRGDLTERLRNEFNEDIESEEEKIVLCI